MNERILTEKWKLEKQMNKSINYDYGKSLPSTNYNMF